MKNKILLELTDQQLDVFQRYLIYAKKLMGQEICKLSEKSEEKEQENAKLDLQYWIDITEVVQEK